MFNLQVFLEFTQIPQKFTLEASKNTISEIVFGIEMSRVVTKVTKEIGMPKQ